MSSLNKEIKLSQDLFDNDKWHSIRYDDQSGIIGYIGSIGILSIDEMGNRCIGEKYKPYNWQARPSVSGNIVKNGKKFWLVYHRVVVAVALGIYYIDTDPNVLYIKHVDNNMSNNCINNLQVFEKVSQVYQKFETLTNIPVRPVVPPPSIDVATERMEALTKLGINQTMPTKLYDNDNYIPLHYNHTSGVILYVSDNNILYLSEYGRKVLGHEYNVVEPTTADDGYKIFATKKNRVDYNFRVNRVKVAAALGIAYSDLDTKLEVHTKDFNIDNNLISNLQLFTKKQNAEINGDHNKHKYKDMNKFNIKPVKVVDENDNVKLEYDSLDEASEYTKNTKTVIMNAIHDKTWLQFKINGEDGEEDDEFKGQWRYGEQEYTGKIKKLDQAKVWYDLVNPKTGNIVQGYQISDNLILKLPTGRYTEGSVKKDPRRIYFRIKGQASCVDTRWGEASKTKAALPIKIHMAHNNNNYENVTVDSVRQATARENNVEARGKKVIARFHEIIKAPIIYDCIKDAADANNLSGTTLATALREKRAYYNGIKYDYYEDLMIPSGPKQILPIKLKK